MAGLPYRDIPTRPHFTEFADMTFDPNPEYWAPFASLTDREEQVLLAICDGESAAGIAADWEVSVATVRSHIRAVLAKLGAGSQLEAAAMARWVGWPWAATGRETANLMSMSHRT